MFQVFFRYHASCLSASFRVGIVIVVLRMTVREVRDDDRLA